MNNKRKAERLVRMLTDGYSGMKAVREVIELLEQWPDETQSAVADPVAWVDALKDAFFEGFASVETYNDTFLNSAEEAWATYTPPAAQPAQPAWYACKTQGGEFDVTFVATRDEAIAQVEYALADDPSLKFEDLIVNLYTGPQQRTWVGLTDEEILQGNKESWVTLQAWQSSVWWAEAKLKEKNT
jgi:hypothetical protein